MGRRVRVLIADDQPRARHSLRSLLATWPEIEVVGEAADGQEAVQLAGICDPDVVLMDLCMPVMDGLAATQAIKSHWPEIRVVVLTMYTDHTPDEAFAAGADAFQVKGKPAKELLSAILMEQPRVQGVGAHGNAG
ncbi:MAG: response regulator transcription factor [Anaerolineae bacterium]|nr:response regulator transcription factor [Anaerolineae bacterium]